MHLAQIGDDVAMGQHRPFRHAGRPAGILKERDVGRLDGRFRERLQPAQGEGAIEAHRPREPPRGNGAPDMTQDEIDDRPSGEAQLVARAGDDDGPDRRALNRLFERLREVFQYDNRFRARIDELMIELARGVEWVAVDDDITCPQGAKEGDRILQQVRHHQRDASAARQARDILQVARELAGLLVEFAVRHRRAHAEEGGPVAELLDARFDEIADRADRLRVDVRRHALGIGLQPYPFHINLFLERVSALVQLRI